MPEIKARREALQSAAREQPESGRNARRKDHDSKLEVSQDTAQTAATYLGPQDAKDVEEEQGH